MKGNMKIGIATILVLLMALSTAGTASASNSCLNATTSYLNATKPVAVANGTDNLMMQFEARDTNNTLINNTDFTVTTNRTEDSYPSTITTNDTGIAIFNITSTKAGPVNVTVTSTKDENCSISNTTGVFTAGPAYKLAWFGPDNSLTGVDTINQSVAIQDQYGNNVTRDEMNGSDPFKLTASVISGNATVSSTNPIIIDETYAESLTANNVNYSATFDLANFTFEDEVDETVTIKVKANHTVIAAEKDITFQASVSSLEVTTETSMYANDGNDTILVTVQLKDSAGNDVYSSGVVVELGASTDPTLFDIGSPTNRTNSMGLTTFLVNSTHKDGSDELEATVTENPAPGGGTGQTGTSDTITLLPVFNAGNSDVVSLTATIRANETSTITAMIKAYDGEAYAGKEVTFNLTSGDGTFADGTTLTTDITDSNGNATAIVTSTNASTTLTINVTTVDEFGDVQQVGDLQTIDVTPNAVAQISVDPSKSIGLKNVNGTTQEINITLQDQYGNFNSSVGTAVVTTDNTALGYMTNDTTPYDNNLTVGISGGVGLFNYTVNTSEPGSATLTVNVTTYGIVEEITIVTSGPKDVEVTVDDKTTNIDEGAIFTAQLVDADGNPLAINNTKMTITVSNSTGVVNITTDLTNLDGVCEYNLSNSLYPDTYTVTFANETESGETISGSNSTVVAGDAKSLTISADSKSVNVSVPINVTVTARDKNGVQAYGYNEDVYIVNEDTGTAKSLSLSDGSGVKTYNKSTNTSLTIYAYRSGLTQSNNITLEWKEEEAPALTVTANVTSVVVSTSTPAEFNVTSDGVAADGALVSVSQAGVELVNGTTDASGLVTLSVNATSTVTVNVTASKTDYTDGTTTIEVTPAMTLLDYYRTLDDGDTSTVTDIEILKAEDDWVGNVIPPGFDRHLSDMEILTLEDEWVAT